LTRIAVLDDYWHIASQLADWSSLAGVDVDAHRLRERALRLTELASSGRTSVEDVRSVVARTQR
jgi:hypothetical protein